ncbi:serine-rich adhesin for platelets-like [Nymphalis io]|uniref:serine-rich adhesin for platelets-like n=1 Tax=Inachis io TaxID=171585 RepID=UPI0021688F8B|nr:serine-rich adhesin for platelets-like [Nymphalis io]
MGVLLKFFLVTVVLPCVFGQAQEECFGAGSVAGAAIGAFIAAFILIGAAYYLRKLYWKSRKGKHLVFTTDPESVKDEFAFDNPGFRQEEKNWQHEAPTLPLGGKTHALHAEFTKPEQCKDDSYLQRARVRRVKLWARDFTGLGLTCGGGARDGVCVHSILRSGPAAAAKIQPGDKIKSIKIEFTGTPLEDAVSILSLASPYPVELEIVEGGRISGEGWRVHHPLMKRAGSTGDVNTLEKEGKLLHPPKSPITSHSNNSTLETKQTKGGIKKIITEKIITTTLERNKKEKKDPPTTLERENEKNSKLANKARHSDIPANFNKPERNKNRNSTGSDIQIIQPENGISHFEHAEVQKREYDPKRGMKFGIRVLPPNVPDDGVLKQKSIENGAIVLEKKSVDEPDKPEPQRSAPVAQIKHENETEQKKPVVAKRREKIAPPIPNARVKTTETDVNVSHETSKTSETSSLSSSFTRTDLNSSGIKRDENGIPQELPQHMFDAAKAARSNRKSSAELIQEKEKVEHKKEEAPKPKKSKGKAPSPPEPEKNKSDDSILEQMKNLHDFLKNEKHHSSLLHDSFTSNKSVSSYNTSTPKVNKTKSRLDESINFSQDDIDDIVGKPFKRESDSLNNFFEDSKSNLSSNQDVHSVVSLNNSDKSDKGSTTIELNNSDITIHSSPLNDTGRSTSDDTSILDENERKAASLGDLSRFELRAKTSKPSTGTLERAQSLDISADDAEIQESTLSPKKRKAMSVVETTFFDSGNEDVLPDMIDSDKGVSKQKEPRLSLNIAKTSAMEGLNTFQRNRLKKASEFGNLEDAIVKGSNSSMDSNKHGSQEILLRKPQTNLDSTQESDEHETSDHLARRIMDENLKVHLKLVSEFAKSTSDGSNSSSLDSSQESHTAQTVTEAKPIKYEEKLTMTYDTNIPDDMKVSRSSYVNSLERPKSEMMKKLLAKNPIFNVHVDQAAQKYEASTSKDTPALTDSFKSTMHQPDIVNFDLKTSSAAPKNRDYEEFVSNIRVGSNNNSLKHNKKPQETFSTDWSESKNREIQSSNIVTISTDDKNVNSDSKTNSYTKSIEIGESSLRLVPDLVEGTKSRTEEKETRTLYMEPANVSLSMKQEPVQKTVMVNVTEDDYGNKVITQNVEKVSTKYVSSKIEAPLQIEQLTFGIMKGAGTINESELEEGNVKDFDKKVLEDIRRQNPNLHFTTTEPSFTRTETIILNTADMNEEEAKALMEKLQNDPSFMAQKSSEELSRMGIRIIQDLDDKNTANQDTVEVTKTRYSINPTLISTDQNICNIESKDSESQKDHVTEIQVVTPRTEKIINEKSEINKDKISSRQRAPAAVKKYEEPVLSYELDMELLNDFISNERYHSAKHQADMRKRTSQTTNEPKKRHSDFDLPRNSHIKFRTATYESPKGTIVTSTDLENRRLSQLDQMQLRSQNDQSASSEKPVISAKPSNIPVKSLDKKPLGGFVSSKIPVFATQKSLSQENLSDKNFSLPRSPPPGLSSSSGNISITSIKSSSRSPSGGRL